MAHVALYYLDVDLEALAEPRHYPFDGFGIRASSKQRNIMEPLLKCCQNLRRLMLWNCGEDFVDLVDMYCSHLQILGYNKEKVDAMTLEGIKRSCSDESDDGLRALYVFNHWSDENLDERGRLPKLVHSLIRLQRPLQTLELELASQQRELSDENDSYSNNNDIEKTSLCEKSDHYLLTNQLLDALAHINTLTDVNFSSCSPKISKGLQRCFSKLSTIKLMHIYLYGLRACFR
ncbi:hypothetical protein BDA99DRAFT_571730 [Phascolomyces articulosus]|uniref:Uncharacterized protein n=1 Tax=Phascolomyces articulosus TaxID=60185 RepID=A0AAD5KAZ0_9FUNG|nr:hypothetical protein BDA99DRAFT_571730 [Phascolomyces articulosus]